MGPTISRPGRSARDRRSRNAPVEADVPTAPTVAGIPARIVPGTGSRGRLVTGRKAPAAPGGRARNGAPLLPGPRSSCSEAESLAPPGVLSDTLARVRRAFLAFLLASAAAARNPRAPLGLRTQGPLRELFLEVTARTRAAFPRPSSTCATRSPIPGTSDGRRGWTARVRRRSWTSRRTPLRCGGACRGRVRSARPLPVSPPPWRGASRCTGAGTPTVPSKPALVQRRLQLPARRLSAQPAPSPLRRRRRPGLRARRGLGLRGGRSGPAHQVTLAEAPGWGVAARLDLKLRSDRWAGRRDPAGSMPAPACSGRWSRRAG